MYQAHTPATASGRSLDHHWIADPFGLTDKQVVVLIVAFVPWHAGHASFDHAPLGPGLVAHDADRIRHRADEHDSGISTLFREFRVFGKESVAGMQCVGATGFGGRQHPLGGQVRFTQRAGTQSKASSASSTCRAPASASLKIATVA
jgi:hypothetical protein